MSRENRPPHRIFGRLNLEALESRLNPADFWWCPASGDLSTTASNWVMGPSAPYARWAVAPGPNDDLYFRGDVSTADCTIPQPADPSPAAYAFHGLHLLFGPVVITRTGQTNQAAYTGTVTAEGSFAVGTLEVECGQIAQDDPATVGGGEAGTLTVKNFLDWTGGTLNSNTVAGTIALAPGASGVAAPSFTNPGINGTVALGSDLTTLGNSTLTLKNGTYRTSVDASFHVAGTSLLIMAPVPKVTPPPPPVDGDIYIDDKPGQRVKGMVTVDSDATAVVQPDDPEANPLATVKVTLSGTNPGITNSGTVKLAGNTEVIFKPVGVNNVSGGYSQAPNFAVTEVASGAKFTCQKQTKVEITGGILRLLDKPHDPNSVPASQSDIVIENTTGDTALVLGSDGVIERPAASEIPLTLKVTGAFDMNGQVKLLADSTVNLRSDLIDVTKKIEVGSSAKVTMGWFAVVGTAVGVNDGWILMQSADPAAAPITAEPQFSHSAGINGITLLVGGRSFDNKRYEVRREQ